MEEGFMKRIILILVMLLTIVIYGKERVEDILRLEERNGVIYVIGEEKPYDGVSIEKYEENKLHIISDKNGENKSYYKGGKLRKEIIYRNGIKEGIEKIYYPNGQVNEVTAYKKGKKDGERKGYYPDGKLWYEAFYINDKEEGIEKTYYKNGNLWLEIPYKSSKIVGVEKRYYESGELFGEITYNDNEVKEVYYDKNGNIKE